MIPIHKKGSRRKSEGPGAPQVYIHGKVQGWAIWALAFRRFRTQFFSQYAGSALGVMWQIIQPLSMIGIYILVFGYIIQIRPNIEEVPYGVYLCSGLIPWLAFQDSVVKVSTAFTANAQFLKRMHVAEEIFLIERLLHVAVTLAISFSGVIAFSLMNGVSPCSTWLVLPVVFILLLLCGGGLGWSCSLLVPYFSDLSQVVQIALRPMFWMTPVIYPLTQVENPVLLRLVQIQPITPFVLGVRGILFDSQIPSAELWVQMLGWSAFCFCIGLFTSRIVGSRFRDVL